MAKVWQTHEFFRPKGTHQFWHRAIWKSFIPPRFSITMWFALHGRLKTVDRIKYMDVLRQCLLCSNHDESHDHLFFSCPKTRCLWALVKSWLGIKGRVSTILCALRYCSRHKAESGYCGKQGGLLSLLR